MKLSYMKLEVGNVEIKNIMRFQPNLRRCVFRSSVGVGGGGGLSKTFTILVLPFVYQTSIIFMTSRGLEDSYCFTDAVLDDKPVPPKNTS